MPAEVIHHVWAVRLRWGLADSADGINVLHVLSGDAALTLSVADDIADAVSGAIGASGGLQSVQSDLVELISIDVIDQQQDPNFGFTKAYATTGDLTDSPLPNQVALVTSLKTGLMGRSYRGRIYWPGFTEADSVGNYCVSGVQTAVGVTMTAMMVDLATLGHQLCVASKKLDTGHAVTTYNTDARWDIQRRRAIRV